MGIKILNTKFFFNFFLATIIISGFYYLSSHVMRGDRGITSLFELSRKSTNLQKELDLVRAEKFNLEHKVQGLRSDSLDLDLLDEQARKIIGLSDPDEVVYLLKK